MENGHFDGTSFCATLPAETDSRSTRMSSCLRLIRGMKSTLTTTHGR